MSNSTPDIIICHISDLHFGPYLQGVSRTGEWASTSAPHDFNLLQGMESALNMPSILEKYKDRLIIAITGDLTTSAEPPAYEAVNNYLRDYPFVSSSVRVGLKLHENKDKIFFVPGNHDIWFYGKFLTKWKRYPNRREQYGKYFKYEFPIVNPLVINGVSITVFSIDSNCVKKTIFNLANVLGKGQVGKEQIAAIQALHNRLSDRTLENIPNGYDYSSSLKIALLHHHLALPSGVPKDIQQKMLELKDSSSVLNLFSQIGIRLILCGHQHFPYHIPNLKSQSNPNHSMFLSCAGSATQLDCKNNSFTIYEIHKKNNGYKLHLKTYKADPKNYSYLFSVVSDLQFNI